MPTAASRPTYRVARSSPEAMARFFRALGDPTRLRLLQALLERERSVGELVNLVGAPQSRVSNHLACLKWCRFAESERRGRQVIYRVTDPHLRELIRLAEPLAGRNRDHLESCERIGPEWV